MRDKIAKIPGLLDVTTDLYVTNPQVMIEVDREKAAVYGVTIDQVRQELFDAFGTRQVATIYTAEQRLPGDPGDQAGIPDRSVERCREYLRQDQRRRRRQQSRRRHGCRAGRGRHRQRHPGWTVDPAVGGDQGGAVGRAAAGQPSGPAARGDDLVQPRAGLCARRRDRRDPGASSANSTCRPRSRPASRAPRRCSRSR